MTDEMGGVNVFHLGTFKKNFVLTSMFAVFIAYVMSRGCSAFLSICSLKGALAIAVTT